MHSLRDVNSFSPLNRSHPLACGLNGAWFGLPGRRGGFRLYDMAGINHATISSGTVWEGNAVKFSSATSNSAIVVGNASVPPALSISSMPTWSMFMYLKLNSSQSDSWPVAMTYGRWGATLGISSASSPAGRIEHWRNNSSNYLSNTTMPTGEWLQIGIVFNGSSVTFYLKGAADGTSTTGSYGAANGFGMGGNTHGGGGAFQGSIASAFLYSRALSAAEAVRLNYEMASGFPSLLNRRRAYWDVPQAGEGGSVLPIFRHHYVTQGIA